MRLVVAVAGLLFAAVPASAQYYGPRPAVPIGPPSAYDVAEIVQAMGLDPIGPPGRSGAFFVQRARDDFGRVLNVTVDARRSQVIAVEALGHANAPYGRYAGYGPYRRRIRAMGRFRPTTRSISQPRARSWARACRLTRSCQRHALLP